MDLQKMFSGVNQAIGIHNAKGKKDGKGFDLSRKGQGINSTKGDMSVAERLNAKDEEIAAIQLMATNKGIDVGNENKTALKKISPAIYASVLDKIDEAQTLKVFWVRRGLRLKMFCKI